MEDWNKVRQGGHPSIDLAHVAPEAATKTRHVDISKNRGVPPKWMVKIRENPIKMDDLGGKPTIFGNIHIKAGEFFESQKIFKTKVASENRRHLGKSLQVHVLLQVSFQSALPGLG